MQRFYVVNSQEKIVGEGVRFSGEENAIRWLPDSWHDAAARLEARGHGTTSDVPVSRAWRVQTSELAEILEQRHLHLFWLDGMDVPVPATHGIQRVEISVSDGDHPPDVVAQKVVERLKKDPADE